LADALRYAVSLGGDTDTIAAIVDGILGSRPCQIWAI
jgi:ADP-ribosylglycohydrolase